MNNNFDVIVIGSGPGGYVCAIRSSQLGLKTACVETRDTLGGTCLNIGCIPSKSLLHSSEFYQKANSEFNDLGIETGKIKLNLSKMMSNKSQSILNLTKGIKFLFKKNKVTQLHGKGSVLGKDTVSVIDGIALPVVEIIPNGKFYDYNSKYTKGQSEYEIPAKLDLALDNKLEEYAENLYELVGCRHYARIDFILDKNNDVYILEINTLPGLTDTSLFPKAYNEEFKNLADKPSKTYDLLVLEIIKLALK